MDEAIKELQFICEENPDFLEARTHLARVLSWKGKLAEAIEEADKVLKQSPDDLQALIVKADALQWQGRYKAAVPVYREILERNNVLLDDGPDNKWNRIWLEKWGQDP